MDEVEEQAPVQPELEENHHDIRESQDHEEEGKDSYERIASDAQGAETEEAAELAREDIEEQAEALPTPPPKDGADDIREQEPSTTPPVPTQSTEPGTPSQEGSTPTTAPDTPTGIPSRSRTDSQSTTATNATRSTIRSTRSSLVFVIQALESIAASKDAKKRKALADSTQRALSAIRSAQGDASQINPEVLFEPLNLATEASTVTVVTTALDCIGKLISYSYFSAPPPTPEPPPHQEDGAPPPPPPKQQPPLIERAIDTICECFQGEATPAEIEMQIIKSLLAAVLNDKIVVHGAGLLKSVRQMYNIFLLSKSSANQQIAQGTVSQMVGTVFERVKARLAAKAARANSSNASLTAAATTNGEHDGNVNGTATPAAGDEIPADPEPETPVEKEQRMTLQTFETRKSFDDTRLTDAAPTTVTRATRSSHPTRRNISGHEAVPSITVQSNSNDSTSILSEDDEDDEIHIKDAFLVFRAMCKLSTKPLRVEEAVDVKSPGMRSKLLSLHILHTVLFNHPTVFTSPHATIKSSGSGEPTGFTQAIKQYLCLSLSRNGASSVQRVFEVSAEIFGLMLQHLRSQLKRELEVFLKEIYLAILDKRAAPAWQKQYIVHHIFSTHLASDPKVLVEIYLNYDCDRNALDNMFQRIVEHVARIAGQPVSANGLQQQAYQAHAAEKRELGSSGGGSGGADWRERGTLPPSLATASMGGSSAIQAMVADERFPQEYAMKMQALECLVEVLRSLVRWGQQGMASAAAENVLATGGEAEGRGSSEEFRESIDTRAGNEPLGTPTTAPDSASTGFPGMDTPPIAEDDPAELEKVKARKTALNNAIRQFNFKPKRGIKLLIADGFIPSSNPTDIGHFLISNELLNKKALGEFLGEGDEENIKIMHAYVDSMDFVRTRFVDALRRFLQAFRLPGEAQKIDRLMLKFAERYTSGNPNAFANADTAYVLGYSVIMLNTDQHSAQVKNRMTIEDFIKNNRGINDNANLPDEYLTGIYEEIREHEIVLDTERATEANLRGAVPQNASQGGGLASVVGNLGRDLQREAYAAASEEMSNRTEQLFRSLLRAQKRGVGSAGGVNGIGEKAGGKYLTASSFRHVGPMFEVTWMGFLTALSGSAQETSNLEAIRMCMEGQKLAVRIACLFDLQDPRQAFVGSLARSTNLYNLSEMKAKNVEALRVLLDVAFSEGNGLKESWRDILTCVSQLDRFQLISSGVEEGAVPDVMRTQTMTPTGTGRKSVQIPRRPTSRAPGSSGQYQPDIAEESKSADMIRIVDRIFTNTANLSGDAIVHFVRSLTQVSWQEIQSSGQSDSPRTYSLQKLVEISGYNMLRVRFEWTNIWQVLGQHFIDVGCHNNTHVVFFALNSLRQLSMRFMEIEELPGFKFQKDFLKPFELILGNASQVAVKDMVLRCLIQMIQARGDMIRSGWRTMFGVFTVAAKEPYESIVNLAFDNVTQVYSERFGVVISQGAFADLVVCLTEFSKNMKFQKKSLQAIETLRSSVPKMLRTPECPLSQKAIGEGVVMEKAQAEGLPKQPSRQTQEEQFWFPVLFAFHDVLMTGEDLEVRSRALNYLFETLTKYGRDFPRDFWDTLWRQLLYPIFMVLKDRKALNQDAINHEDLSVWLSTTLIQALRNMISLFTHFFESLEYMLDRFLDLLALCICQENDTLARIGSNCLQQLILQNVKKFSPVHWEKIVGAFVDLFARTEAKELFSAATSSAYERRESSFGNGVPETPKTASVFSSTPDGDGNALRINGLPQDSSAEVATVNVNGDNRPPSLRTETSNSLALSDETERSISPAANPPPKGSSELEDFAAGPPTKQTAVTPARRRYFNQIITKCVLQLLMIETVSELFNNDAVYASIPSTCLLRLMSLLKKSYHFAKRFNDDRDLRTRLFREGFMKQPPNLLKQESGSASVYVLILLRMYADTSAERAASRPETEAALIPLCSDIIASYVSLDEETQQRNIATWRPVVIDVLEGYNGFGEVEFAKHVDSFAPLAVGLMGREMGVELQRAVQGFWGRVCEVKLGVERGRLEMGVGVVSPRGGAGVFGERRGSRVK